MSGCSLLAPIRDHTFDLADGGPGFDSGQVDGGGADAGALDAGADAGPGCSEACLGATPVCDTTRDQCVACLEPADCDDGDPCTADRCNLDNTCTSTLDALCPRQVVVGSAHTCLRRAGGSVRCWGSNRSGQIGVAPAGSPVTTPRLVAGIDDAIDLAAGSEFTCAIRRSGVAACWGANGFGQLGNGTEDDSTAAIEVTGLADAVQVSAGSFHACALRATGEVVCWGWGGFGQLGDGMTDFAHESHIPTPVLGLTGVTQLAAQGEHTCALRDDATAVCWGRNGQGELGDGNPMLDVPTPVLVVDLIDATQISGHCARRESGVAACWGPNDAGQIGDGSELPSSRPVTVTGLTETVDVVSSDDVACARRASGETLCWGSNSTGQLGVGDLDERHVPTVLTGLSGVSYLAVGDSHACAIRHPREVWCWGDDSAAQVSGRDIGDRHLVPVEVAGL